MLALVRVKNSIKDFARVNTPQVHANKESSHKGFVLQKDLISLLRSMESSGAGKETSISLKEG